ncbi:MAG: YHYH protein [Ornithinimicrobium sp.]
MGDATIEIDGTTPDGTYTSDYVFEETAGDLDECNGIEINGEYAYLITDEYPYVSRCLNGEVTSEGGPGPGGGEGQMGPRQRGGPGQGEGAGSMIVPGGGPAATEDSMQG